MFSRYWRYSSGTCTTFVSPTVLGGVPWRYTVTMRFGKRVLGLTFTLDQGMNLVPPKAMPFSKYSIELGNTLQEMTALEVCCGSLSKFQVQMMDEPHRVALVVPDSQCGLVSITHFVKCLIRSGWQGGRGDEKLTTHRIQQKPRGRLSETGLNNRLICVAADMKIE